MDTSKNKSNKSNKSNNEEILSEDFIEKDEVYIETQDSSDENLDTDVKDFVNIFDELKVELDEANDRILRMAAEMENLRKRALKEKEDASKYSISKFSREIIIVSDNIERALNSIQGIELPENEAISNLITGIEITSRELQQVFTRHGIERFDPSGEKFDPVYHEAMFEIPDETAETGIVVQVLEPGYKIKDRILRPARVGVSKGK
ncbi:nucleotide exchange factor GrpE [Hyphomicrobiales bacterium]|jgi:molecular chaperone GrpE|nr:nucleotide exchange factor GrpE [Rhodobiaceae bacterium]MBT6223649.1 nucleotide exchange factor GrpE [Rhodobiaceae bacterium]MDB4127911.1 nucleotide exchange factor GrpE [Hyphomicrobiales bacterium]|tara:strand:- start:1604 stop:2221 length:618 start_codon:yes stop_codon:yes gene_type:complete